MDMSFKGGALGVDFNPTVDRLRVVSPTAAGNLRVNVDTGATTVDSTLTYPANPPTVPDAVTATGVSGAVYTNNDSDPNTATTLYDLD